MSATSTESMRLLTAAYAEDQQVNLDEFRKSYYGALRFEPPKCRDCRGDT